MSYFTRNGLRNLDRTLDAGADGVAGLRVESESVTPTSTSGPLGGYRR